jgi:hypothetical protein
MKLRVEQSLKGVPAPARQEWQSKLTPSQDFIINAAREGMPLTAVRTIFRTMCHLEGSYNDLPEARHRLLRCLAARLS